MRIQGRWFAAAATAGLLLFGGVEGLLAASAPAIYSSTMAKDTATDRTVLTLVGKSLTKLGGFALADSNGLPVPGTIDILLKSKGTLEIEFPAGIPGGEYDLATTIGAAAGPSLHLRIDSGVLFPGTLGSGTILAEGAGARMMWYGRKGAFRAGSVDGVQWDDASVGFVSVATGNDTIASEDYSTAMGNLTTASAPYSTAMGLFSSATGSASTAMGKSTNAGGASSTAMGESSSAGGTHSTAMGYFTTASGSESTAMGSGTSASGAAATAMGGSTTSNAFASTAMGYFTTASGSFSTSMSLYTTAQSYGSLALGRYNADAGSKTSWNAADPILVVGNGTGPTDLLNAFTLLKNGNLTIAGTLTQNSDERLKKEVTPLAGVLRKIAAIRGVTYRMKDEARGPAGPQIGLLAQEVRKVFPELVHEDAQGTLSVAYGNFSAVLLEAVKEQQAVLEDRDREVAALKKELAEQRAATDARLSRLEALLPGSSAPAKGK